MSLTHLDNSNFEAEVIKSDKPVLVDFYADWCGPCRMIAPSIEKLAEEYSSEMKVCKLNVDKAGETAAKFGISGIPAVLFFKKGNVVDQFTGALPKDGIEAYIKKNIN
ncbi:MAG: thioredoxin [Spirochaetes bacterium]|nr:thioredoxin [Spirochaetota bacterium]